MSASLKCAFDYDRWRIKVSPAAAALVKIVEMIIGHDTAHPSLLAPHPESINPRQWRGDHRCCFSGVADKAVPDRMCDIINFG